MTGSKLQQTALVIL